MARVPFLYPGIVAIRLEFSGKKNDMVLKGIGIVLVEEMEGKVREIVYKI